jgi:hypothetical protein
MSTTGIPKPNLARRVRELTAQGLSVEAVATLCDLKPSEVKRAKVRRPRRGRPGGNLDLDTQIIWCRRITQSGPTVRAREVAYQLLDILLHEQGTRSKTEQAGGSKTEQAGGIEQAGDE